MTDEQINQLELGREMDILIAEMLTGKNRLECRTDPMNRDGEPQFYWCYPAGHDFAPEYSTSIAAAWSVVEKLRADGWNIEIYLWQTQIVVEIYRRGREADVTRQRGNDVCLLICRAALRAAHAEGK